MLKGEKTSTQTYLTLVSAVRATCEQWCYLNGYTDPFLHNGEWWAFPPAAVMPVKIKDVINLDNTIPNKVYIGLVCCLLLPDGSFASKLWENEHITTKNESQNTSLK